MLLFIKSSYFETKDCPFGFIAIIRNKNMGNLFILLQSKLILKNILDYYQVVKTKPFKE